MIIYPFREKTVLSAATLALSPVPGRSFKITDIQIKTSESEDYATLRSGLTSVGYFSVGDGDHNHLSLFPDISNPESLRHFFEAADLVFDYPVVEGDSFSVTLENAADLIKICYEEYEAGDMTPDLPNAKGASQLLLPLYGTNTDTLDAAGFLLIDKMINPAEFTNFPFESVVPTGRTLRLHAIMFLDVSHNSYTASADTIMQTKYLRLTKNREVLFDMEMNGFYVLGAGAATGSVNTKVNNGTNQLPYCGNKTAGGFFILPEDIEFNSGDELISEVYIDGTFGLFPATTLRLCYLMTLLRITG